eukprot:TRINITY_DN10712_c0_g1_i3.p1 TRINITY_DN10712_c0_g1~~TRINITY_DN10712_c0_g1_i3.p1  ORF type:complete len:439 (-),score=138.29 TRINITY_DN10712_c0_g1_i3:194-1510(-)
MIRRPPRSPLSSSSAASDVYKRQVSTQSTGKENSKSMTEALLGKAEDLFKKGEYLKAAGSWTRAIKKDPSVGSDPLLQCNLCYALLKEHKFAKALEAADASIQMDDKAGRTHYRRGLCLIALERWDDAVLALTIAQTLLGSQDSDCQSMLANSKYHCRVWHENNGGECPKSCEGAEDPRAASKEGKENAKPKTEAEVKAEVKRRMAAKLAAEKAERQHHHAKKLNNTLLAMQTAQKELLTADKEREAAALREADKLPVQLQQTLVSDEDYKKTKEEIQNGEELPYESERVHRFAAHELQSVCDLAKAADYEQPVAIVLPGVANGWGDEGQGINLLGAFESAKQQANTAKWVQTYAGETNSHAVLIVVPKSKLSFPKKLEGWACAKSGGLYVQLEAKEPADRRMWFVTDGAAIEVDVNDNGNLLSEASKKAKKKGKGKK